MGIFTKLIQFFSSLLGMNKGGDESTDHSHYEPNHDAPSQASEHDHNPSLHGTPEDDHLVDRDQGFIIGLEGDDVLTSYASPKPVADLQFPHGHQVHMYGHSGDDILNMGFSENTSQGHIHGHHVFGGPGSDIFNFQDISNIGEGTVAVGRFEDFDPSRDEIQVEGETLDFDDLPSNIRIVEFSESSEKANGYPEQQWILIDTPTGGQIYYVLAGARSHLDAGGKSHEEPHFLQEQDVPDFDSLPSVAYRDPQNHVPYEEYEHGEFVENYGGLELKRSPGLKADDVEGTSGNDVIQTNSAPDVVHGYDGNDLIAGGLDNDVLYGGNGDDKIWGGTEKDRLFGEDGNDELLGGDGQDYLDGGSGADILIGGEGDDVFAYFQGGGVDFIADFEGQTTDDAGKSIAHDKIAISSPNYHQFDELSLLQNGSTLVIDLGEGDEIHLQNASIEDLSEESFEFL